MRRNVRWMLGEILRYGDMVSCSIGGINGTKFICLDVGGLLGILESFCYSDDIDTNM